MNLIPSQKEHFVQFVPFRSGTVDFADHYIHNIPLELVPTLEIASYGPILRNCFRKGTTNDFNKHVLYTLFCTI